jgi:hypothetical protein
MAGVLAVLGALPDCPDTALYGLEIVRASRLEPGTIYPILQRLRGAGWIGGRWEEPVPGRTAIRPPWRYCWPTLEGRARAVHALQRGRDRSGLSRLLVPPASLLLPRSRQARHERFPSAPCRGQRNSWRCRSQRSPGNGRLSSGSRAETQFASLDMRPIARRGGHGLVSGMIPVSPTRPGPRRQTRAHTAVGAAADLDQLDVRVRCVALAPVSVETALSKHCPVEGDKNVDS